MLVSKSRKRNYLIRKTGRSWSVPKQRHLFRDFDLQLRLDLTETGMIQAGKSSEAFPSPILRPIPDPSLETRSRSQRLLDVLLPNLADMVTGPSQRLKVPGFGLKLISRPLLQLHSGIFLDEIKAALIVVFVQADDQFDGMPSCTSAGRPVHEERLEICLGVSGCSSNPSEWGAHIVQRTSFKEGSGPLYPAMA